MSDFPPCRLLRKNHRVSFPRRMIYLDAETAWKDQGLEQYHRMRLAWTCYYERRRNDRPPTEKWEEFKKTYPFNRYIESRAIDNMPLHIFGHNVFFDLQASDFFFYFTLWGWSLEFIYDQGLTYILVIKKGDKTIRVISTTNYFQTTLKELGDLVGIPKWEVDFRTATEDELSGYCHRDVRIIKVAMERYFDFVRENDFGAFGLSRASQAWRAYRHRFMDKKIYVHDDKPAQAIEEGAYVGGRTECFQIGKIEGGPFVALDVNSLYPHVMRETRVPNKLIESSAPLSIEELREYLTKYLVIAEVDLETDEPAYAVRKDEKIIFPVGRFQAFLCTPALDHALVHGHLKRVVRANTYTGEYLFERYINELYALRLRFKSEGNQVYQLLSKYLMLSLYGKFAQYTPVQDVRDDMTCSGYDRLETWDMVTGERMIEYKLFNKVVSVYGKEIGKSSLMAIPAHITEGARLLLWGIIKQVGPDRVFYCDTDSVMIRKADVGRLAGWMDPNELGKLKIEKEGADLEIRGCKNYSFDGDRVIKGVPHDAVEVKPGVFEFMSFPGQVSHMVAGETRAFIAKTMFRRISGGYDKGRVDSSGRVFPFRLESPETPL